MKIEETGTPSPKQLNDPETYVHGHTHFIQGLGILVGGYLLGP